MILTVLADDTCLFLKNEDQVPVILEALKNFSKDSGLTINQSKCEILTVPNSDVNKWGRVMCL